VRLSRISSPRVVGESCFVALTWLLAGIAYLLSRHAAISPLFWAGAAVVAAEVTYAVNTYASEAIGGRAVSALGRFANRLSFVLLWPIAFVVFAVGAILLFTSPAP
jgi:hypothetical protein